MAPVVNFAGDDSPTPLDCYPTSVVRMEEDFVDRPELRRRRVATPAIRLSSRPSAVVQSTLPVPSPPWRKRTAAAPLHAPWMWGGSGPKLARAVEEEEEGVDEPETVRTPASRSAWWVGLWEAKKLCLLSFLTAWVLVLYAAWKLTPSDLVTGILEAAATGLRETAHSLARRRRQ